MPAQDADGVTTASYPANTPAKPPRERQPSSRVAAVQVHLAAAGLLLGELDLMAEPLQQPHDRLAR